MILYIYHMYPIIGIICLVISFLWGYFVSQQKGNPKEGFLRIFPKVGVSPIYSSTISVLSVDSVSGPLSRIPWSLTSSGIANSQRVQNSLGSSKLKSSLVYSRAGSAVWICWLTGTIWTTTSSLWQTMAGNLVWNLETLILFQINFQVFASPTRPFYSILAWG